MKPKDLYCFKEVSRAIGKKRATAELQKIINKGLINHTGDSPLIGAFTWKDSPQGTDFWVKISNCSISFMTKRVLVLVLLIACLGAYLWIKK